MYFYLFNMPLATLQVIPEILEIKELNINEKMKESILKMPKGEKRLEICLENEQRISAYKFKYNSSGRSVVGYLVEPKGLPSTSGKLPCIIINRGGTGHISQWEDAHMFNNYVAQFAKSGYIVITTQYSGNDGSEGREEFGGMDVEDILNLKPILSSYPYADSDNIGMIGGSRGGLMTYMILSRVDWLKAAVIFAAPSNIEHMYTYRSDMLEFHQTLYDTNSKEELAKRSPVLWADKISKTTPILLIHGVADGVTRAEESINMATLLYKQQIPFEMHLFAGATHFLHEVREEFSDMYFKWFKRFLIEKAEIPNTTLR